MEPFCCNVGLRSLNIIWHNQSKVKGNHAVFGGWGAKGSKGDFTLLSHSKSMKGSGVGELEDFQRKLFAVCHLHLGQSKR